MNVISLSEFRARGLVDRLFEANSSQYGQDCEWPVLGGGYVVGVDPIEEMKEKAVRAILAREWFTANGPPDVAPLPLGYHEREDLKGGHGLLAYILALFARSLDGRNYDVKEHPPFADYVSGVLWEAEHVDGIIGGLPDYSGQRAELKKRFPPRMLPGIGPGLCWQPPRQHAQAMASYRQSLAFAGFPTPEHQNGLTEKSEDRRSISDKGHHRVVAS
jgi:hypothetical protein